MLSTHLRHRNCNIESAFAVKFEVKFIPNPATPCAAVISSSLPSKVRPEGRPPCSSVQQALIFPTSQYVSRRRFAGKFSTFGAVRGSRKWSVLLRKKQARSTQGTRIASEKSLMKQEIIPQGVHLLLFCAARLFLLPFRSC